MDRNKGFVNDAFKYDSGDEKVSVQSKIPFYNNSFDLNHHQY